MGKNNRDHWMDDDRRIEDTCRRREELKKFLRSRRAAVAPPLTDVKGSRKRRTPGLRREEVAALAGVSREWYVWLEQGRDIRMSRQALERIATALHLSPSDRAYLLALVSTDNATASDESAGLEAPLQTVLDSMASCPAIVMNARLDVVAFNRLASRIYDFDAHVGPFATNIIWRAFVEPGIAELDADWEQTVQFPLGLLRANYASRIGDPSFEELIEALRQESPDFARLWESHVVSPLDPRPFPLPGDFSSLRVCVVPFSVGGRPGDVMIVYVPIDAKTRAAFHKYSTNTSAGRTRSGSLRLKRKRTAGV